MFGLKFAHRVILGRLHINLFQWYGHPIRFDVRIIPKPTKLPHYEIRNRETLEAELTKWRLQTNDR